MTYQDYETKADLRLVFQAKEFDRVFYGKDRKDKLLTIAWNRGKQQKVRTDGELNTPPVKLFKVASISLTEILK